MPAGAAAVTCDKWAARDGADTNPGTESAPFKTAQKLADKLTAGQTGCLRQGTYVETIQGVNVLRVGRGGAAGQPLTIRSAPGERARLNGRIYIARGANFVTLSHLDIDGRAPATEANAPVTIVVTAEDTVIESNNITNRGLKSCVLLGTNDLTYGPAVRTLVRRNRFYECGDEANGRLDHHIYLENTDGVRIEENILYGAPGYTIHLYPNAQRTRVAGNVMDTNGGSVIFGGEGTRVSNENVVERNVMTNSLKEPHIRGHWPTGVGVGNVARDNCLHAGGVGNISSKLVGFSISGNLVADPLYRDRAARDYRLRDDSPCLAVLGTEGAEAVAAVVSMPAPEGATAAPPQAPAPAATASPSSSPAASATPAAASERAAPERDAPPEPAPVGPGASPPESNSGTAAGSSRGRIGSGPAAKAKRCPRARAGTSARARASRVRRRRCVAKRRVARQRTGVGNSVQDEEDPELGAGEPQEPVDTPVLSSPEAEVELDLSDDDGLLVVSGEVDAPGARKVTLKAFRATDQARWAPVAWRSVPVRDGRYRAPIARYDGGDWKVELSLRDGDFGVADARILDVPPPGPGAGGEVQSRATPADPADTIVLQRRLRRAGFDVALDGRFGARSERAVRRFQRSHGLLVDGIVGRQTAAALMRYAG